ncbi:quinone oxidoreductase [soil metagenome]
MNVQAIRVSETGGPDVLRLEEVDDPHPGDGEVLVRIEAAGLNFIDVYHRSGQYPLELPTGIGLEGAGTVVGVGDGVDGLADGARVAWSGTLGSYASLVAVSADQVVGVPDDVDLRTAAAVMLQGMTAHYLARSTFPLADGHTALIHAGAGGVGQLLIQLAKLAGARVLTTVSTEDKAELARAAGADEVIRYTEVDFAEEVGRLTDDDGVDVVYESVGKDTFDRSLSCLAPRGHLVLYGQSSGAVEPLDPQRLAAGGSLFLTRPTLFDYIATPDDLRWRAGELFELIADDRLRVRIDRELPLADAAEAHRHIEGRGTRGKVLLLP